MPPPGALKGEILVVWASAFVGRGRQVVLRIDHPSRGRTLRVLRSLPTLIGARARHTRQRKCNWGSNTGFDPGVESASAPRNGSSWRTTPTSP